MRRRRTGWWLRGGPGRWSWRLMGAALALSMGSPLMLAEDSGAAEDSGVRPAAKLIEATVTLRMTAAAEGQPESRTAGRPAAESVDGVTVCSAISLGNGLIVSSLEPAANARFRITIRGGEQAEAQASVADQYTGLLLLETSRKDLPKLTLATETPVVGKRVYSAAAWGTEAPVVSQGILGGVERSIPGRLLPPLLQCDVRASQTSGGAAVVDESGNLLGVAVASAVADDPFGWTYAVPARQIARLVQARQPNKLVVLPRQRAYLGLAMQQQAAAEGVHVKKVTPQGPAAVAGIKDGAQIFECDGYKVRSPLEVAKFAMNRQPGDTLTFRVRQLNEQQQMTEAAIVVKLGNAEATDGALPNTPPGPGTVTVNGELAANGSYTNNTAIVDPRLNVRLYGQQIQVQQALGPAAQQQQRLAVLEELTARNLQRLSEQTAEIDRLKQELARREAVIRSLESKSPTPPPEPK